MPIVPPFAQIIGSALQIVLLSLFVFILLHHRYRSFHCMSLHLNLNIIDDQDLDEYLD